jgi:hypothetical protein
MIGAHCASIGFENAVLCFSRLNRRSYEGVGKLYLSIEVLLPNEDVRLIGRPYLTSDPRWLQPHYPIRT